jgi:hypothetical protein
MCRFAVAAVFCLATSLSYGQTPVWIEQFGTTQDDELGFAAEFGVDGDLWVAGRSRGSFGAPSAGGRDAVVLKYSPSGSAVFVKQWGTAADDDANDLITMPDGGAVVCGSTGGSFGGPGAGNWDGWIRRVDSNGNATWSVQVGSPGEDHATSLAPDGNGGFFVSGYTSGALAGSVGWLDAWLAHYDSSGTRSWIHQIGTQDADLSFAVTSDGLGGVIISGMTAGDLYASNAGGYWDGWISRFGPAGNQIWAHQFGSSGHDDLRALAYDGAGHFYVGGQTNGVLGSLGYGGFDVWLSRRDVATGSFVWTRQFGTATTEDYYGAIAVDQQHRPYISTVAFASLSGSHAGAADIALVRLETDGTASWAYQLGTPGDDQGAVACDLQGNLFVAGSTSGTLGATSVGLIDAFIARFGYTCFLDQDQDSFGAGIAVVSNQICLQGFAQQSGDCDDTRATVYPGAPELCDGIDNDCDGAVDDGLTFSSWSPDGDGDGYGATVASLVSCTQPTGYVGTSNDCDDTRANVYPGAPELCDGLDNDCDGAVDEGFMSTYCTAGTTINGCVPSISGSGVPSVSNGSGFVISVSNVPGQRYGTMMYSFNPVAVQWSPISTSYRCVAFPVQRFGDLSSGGTAGQCNGTLSIDFNQWYATHPGAMGAPYVPGSILYAQGWFRDPAAPKQTNLSNGLRFTLCN